MEDTLFPHAEHNHSHTQKPVMEKNRMHNHHNLKQLPSVTEGKLLKANTYTPAVASKVMLDTK